MISTLKARILSSIQTKKINVFLLFLVFAFIILILTKLSKSYTNTIAFNINMVNIPEEHVILNDSNNELKVTLKAYGFKLLKYYLSKPDIDIDFAKNIDRTESVYIWTKDKAFASINSQFVGQVEIVNISPDSLRFRYDVNATKKIPVVLNYDIEFSPGFDVMKPYRITPDSIKILGPSALVAGINFLETDTLKLSDVKTNIETVVKIQLPKDLNELQFSDSETTVSGTVEKFTEGHLKLPVNIKNVPESISLKYFPREVNVSYYTNLKNFRNITANDFRVVCDYSKINDQQSFLIPELVEIPDSVKSVRLLNKRVEFIIAK